MITINSLKEMQKYYDKKANIYIFSEDLTLMFDVDVGSDIFGYDITARNIKANDITALDIDANDIDAGDIKANDIDAGDIDYYSVCIAKNSFKCKSVTGRRKNSIHKCLDKEIEYIK